MMRRSAFTMLELIFVIVIMGLLANYGVELLSRAYKSFIFTSVNNTLQANSAMAVESIAARLEYRIKDSVIAREAGGNFSALAGYTAATAPILEWVGSDIDGFRGSSSTNPNWSGIIDIGTSTATTLNSPETNTTAINELIGVLSNGGSTINDAALYFIGSDSDIRTGYGWNGAITTQNEAMHPINSVAGQPTQFVSGLGVSFAGSDVYEYYQLAWTAYAVGISDYDGETGTLRLYYDYQPWKGESYTNAKNEILMENVSTFRFVAVGSILKIEVCVKTNLLEAYSLCKEKTVF